MRLPWKRTIDPQLAAVRVDGGDVELAGAECRVSRWILGDENFLHDIDVGEAVVPIVCVLLDLEERARAVLSWSPRTCSHSRLEAHQVSEFINRLLWENRVVLLTQIHKERTESKLLGSSARILIDPPDTGLPGAELGPPRGIPASFANLAIRGSGPPLGAAGAGALVGAGAGAVVGALASMSEARIEYVSETVAGEIDRQYRD